MGGLKLAPSMRFCGVSRDPEKLPPESVFRRALEIPFLDSDHVIEERYGKPCGEVFAELGEPKFREVEEDVIAEALATHPGVLALGWGSSIVFPYSAAPHGCARCFSGYFRC